MHINLCMLFYLYYYICYDFVHVYTGTILFCQLMHIIHNYQLFRSIGSAGFSKVFAIGTLLEKYNFLELDILKICIKCIVIPKIFSTLDKVTQSEVDFIKCSYFGSRRRLACLISSHRTSFSRKRTWC